MLMAARNVPSGANAEIGADGWDAQAVMSVVMMSNAARQYSVVIRNGLSRGPTHERQRCRLQKKCSGALRESCAKYETWKGQLNVHDESVSNHLKGSVRRVKR